MILRTFRWSFAATAAALVGALVIGGPRACALVAILAVLEVSLSFDNAVINATVLQRMNAVWQRIFLTVGILIAVFGMRLLFPLLIVEVTAGIGPVEAVRLALQGGPADQPGTYAHLLQQAHPRIAAFGGMFLLLLFLDFLLADRKVHWLGWIERPLARAGRFGALSTVIGLIALTVAAETLAEAVGSVMVAGVLGMAAYLTVNGLGDLFAAAGAAEGETAETEEGGARGRAALSLFLYLELLDASLSFDGVIGAFAITQDVFIIACGLGIGAIYIRSITIYLVRTGTLRRYVYLSHGAHWAIGALATILLLSIRYEVPEVVTGLIGVGFVAAATVSSVVEARHQPSTP